MRYALEPAVAVSVELGERCGELGRRQPQPERSEKELAQLGRPQRLALERLERGVLERIVAACRRAQLRERRSAVRRAEGELARLAQPPPAVVALAHVDALAHNLADATDGGRDDDDDEGARR